MRTTLRLTQALAVAVVVFLTVIGSGRAAPATAVDYYGTFVSAGCSDSDSQGCADQFAEVDLHHCGIFCGGVLLIPSSAWQPGTFDRAAFGDVGAVPGSPATHDPDPFPPRA
jgi:hypothetical protein